MTPTFSTAISLVMQTPLDRVQRIWHAAMKVAACTRESHQVHKAPLAQHRPIVDRDFARIRFVPTSVILLLIPAITTMASFAYLHLKLPTQRYAELSCAQAAVGFATLRRHRTFTKASATRFSPV
tara:strand:- start:696 stop:1070 length:375 start_codon:yes stop_codon:yes gene_type:complete